MKALFRYFFLFGFITNVLFISCEKDEGNDTENTSSKSSVQMNITDGRGVQPDTKSATSLSATDDDIIDPEKLTSFEVTFADILLIDTDDNEYSILNSATEIDLREYRGTVKDLLPVEVPIGSYKSVVIKLSGVNITYDNNTYSASTNNEAEVTIGSVNQTISSGIPNAFLSELTFEIPFNFQIVDTVAVQGIRLFFDVETTCKEISIDVPLLETIYFAGIRENINLSLIPEQNIQQIKHSPPLGIEFTTTDNISYYGIHTFTDFQNIGGTINTHTSQHIFRGEDGSLLIEAEDMYENQNPLSTNTINADGETDISADEVFKYLDIKNNLASHGYNLESGKTYYFSLRKTWNITTNGKTYDLTRTCEPIPVTCP